MTFHHLPRHLSLVLTHTHSDQMEMMYDFISLSLQHEQTLLVWIEIPQTVHCTISVRWIVPLGLSLF